MVMNVPHVPQTLWAQRESQVFLTVLVSDAHMEKIEITESAVNVVCQDSSDAPFEVSIEFYEGIDAEQSKYVVNGRGISFVIQKKESGPYWPRLLKSSAKANWLKTDFSKWKDEDEEDEEPQAPDMGGMGGMQGMGGMGGMGGMPGMGGMGGMPGMGGMGGMDFSQFAGMEGMGGGPGGMDFNDSDDEGDDQEAETPLDESADAPHGANVEVTASE